MILDNVTVTVICKYQLITDKRVPLISTFELYTSLSLTKPHSSQLKLVVSNLYDTTYLISMWFLAKFPTEFQLWFSDGLPIKALRGGHGVSSRLIVDRQGFLDLTEIHLPQMIVLDANGSMLQPSQDPEGRSVPVGSSNKAAPWLELSLEIKLGGGFTVGLIPPSTDKSQTTEKGMVTNVFV